MLSRKYTYLLVVLSISTIVGCILSYFLLRTSPHASDSSTRKDSQKNQLSSLRSPKVTDFNNYPIVSDNTMNYQDKTNTDNQNFIQGQQKLYTAINQLNKINKIKDVNSGLKIVQQVKNDLEESEILMQMVTADNIQYPYAYQALQDIKEYKSAADSWHNFFHVRVQSNQGLKPTSKPSFIDLTLKNKSSFIGAMKGKAVALTFDDGPTKEYTPKIIQILQKHNVKATFFVVGKRVRENCEVLRIIYKYGHEIANHSYTHPKLTRLSEEEQRQEIINTQTSINQCLGLNYPTQWFRAPYGDQNKNLLKTVHRLGLNSAQWVVDTNDWKKGSSVSSITAAVNSASTPGVILMHDGSKPNSNFIHANESVTRQNTVTALEMIILNLKSRGFNFCVLSEAFK